MTDLSPAAKAVDDAFWKTINDKWNIYDRRRAQLAAALRAVADQDETLFDENDELMPPVRAVRTDRIIAIADELEGHW